MTLTTVIPERPSPDEARPTQRPIATVAMRDVLTAVGAAASALATTMLLFGRLTPLSGKFGFVVVAITAYVVIYGALVSLTDTRPAVIDRIMTVLLTSAAVLAFFALFSVIVFVLWRGREALFHANFVTSDLSSTGPLDPLDKGGVLHAVVGTLIMTTISMVITVPLGIACAVYLNETGGRATNLVRTVVTSMTALPSILAGLFIFATWILVLGYERSGLAASIAMSIMMLPIIIRSADVVLRLVPGNLREAAQALGAPKWRTVWHVVLPTARSGLTTSVILGVARGVGETAPVLLTAGFTSTLNGNPTKGPMVSLPLAAFELVSSPQPTQVARGFATAAVLMMLVLVLFSIARVLGGRPAGHQSKRQVKQAAKQSQDDALRISQRDALRDLARATHHTTPTLQSTPASAVDLIAEIPR